MKLSSLFTFQTIVLILYSFLTYAFSNIISKRAFPTLLLNHLKPIEPYTQQISSYISSNIRILAISGLFALTQSYDAKAVEPSITSKVSLDISIARAKPERVQIGLFGNEAPASSKFFLSICKGDGISGLSYDGSQVSSIIKNKKIEINKFALGANLKQETYMNGAGVVRIRSVDLAQSAVFDDTNELTHDSPGVISMKKGGGNFGFTIAPAANSELNDENIIIGKILSGMEVITKINDIPVSKEDSLGSKSGFSTLAKNGGDGRGKIASLNRPLKKVVINQCVVDESASFASFMKF